MQSSAHVIDGLLKLLREWGWESGSARLRERLGEAAGDADHGDVGAFFQAWLAAERGEFDRVPHLIDAMSGNDTLCGWAKFVGAFVAMRCKDFDRATRLLDEAEQSLPCDRGRQAAILHVRGAICFHSGNAARADALLTSAKDLLSDDNFYTGRVLDTMGMLYSDRGNFHAAQAFYHRAIELKRKRNDVAGEAVSHGQLGRLHLDWGLLDLAERHFREDLRLCRLDDDQRGHAQMYDALGRVALARGDLRKAAEWLDAAIERAAGVAGWEVLEGFARVDRALAHLAAGTESDLARAASQLTLAAKAFYAIPRPFAEGLAHLDRASGILSRRRGDWAASRQHLRDALNHFQAAGEWTEIARTQLEIARTYDGMGESGAPAVEALRDALTTAERARRPELVRQIERQFAAADAAAYYLRLHERARGRGVEGDPSSLIAGKTEQATVLFLDLQGSTVFTRDHDPAEVMLTLNQMMAELSAALRRHDATVTMFRGDGFMAVVRGQYHARRAVEAALDLRVAMDGFNQPRRLLGLADFSIRVGISTGEMCFGNVGTYDKLDFTAIGRAVNLGARIEPHADTRYPCISPATRESVGDAFTYLDPDGRDVEARQFKPSRIRVWDVTGRVGV